MILENKLHLNQARMSEGEAVHEWINCHYDDIYRFLKHLTRRRECAEDLAQQTFINAYQAYGQFRSDSSMKTWLHRIAFREYIAWRRKRRFLLPLEVLGGKRDPGIDQVDEELTLLSALHQLPPAHREAFLLHEVQQLSVNEVAEVMNIKAGTIKSHLHYARKQLQRHLGEDCEEANS